MKRTGKEWQNLYWSYLKKYKQYLKDYRKEFNKEAKQLPGGKKMDYYTYKNTYAGIETHRLAEQKEGLRGKSLNVQRDILNQQRFGLTYKQGRAYAKAYKIKLKEAIKRVKDENFKAQLKEELKNIKVNKVRQNTTLIENMDEMLSEYNDELYAQGVHNSLKRAQKIAEEFFGSAPQKVI